MQHAHFLAETTLVKFNTLLQQLGKTETSLTVFYSWWTTIFSGVFLLWNLLLLLSGRLHMYSNYCVMQDHFC